MQKHEHKAKSSSAYINASELIAKLPLTNGIHILDVGCGDGYFSYVFFIFKNFRIKYSLLLINVSISFINLPLKA